jgi:hypothetical protein
MIQKLRLTIAATSSGVGTYVQVMSDDMLVNVVLVANEVELVDARPKPESKPKKRGA